MEDAWDFLGWGVVPFSFALNLCFMALNVSIAGSKQSLRVVGGSELSRLGP